MDLNNLDIFSNIFYSFVYFFTFIYFVIYFVSKPDNDDQYWRIWSEISWVKFFVPVKQLGL